MGLRDLGLIVLAGIGFMSVMNSCNGPDYEQANQQAQIIQKYTTVYNNALLRYADTNHDGSVTYAEKDALDVELLKGKHVTLISGSLPRYTDGTQVPLKTITEWLNEYKPSN